MNEDILIGTLEIKLSIYRYYVLTRRKPEGTYEETTRTNKQGYQGSWM